MPGLPFDGAFLVMANRKIAKCALTLVHIMHSLSTAQFACTILSSLDTTRTRYAIQKDIERDVIITTISNTLREGTTAQYVARGLRIAKYVITIHTFNRLLRRELYTNSNCY